jgi:hypothetical protein
MPSLLAATNRYGACVFFACMCCISLVYVFFALPETVGRSLESMDALFEWPWYTVRRVAYADLNGSSGGVQDYEKEDVEKLENSVIKH